jgi:hypothetical protein
LSRSYEHRLIGPGKLSFIIEREINSPHDKHNLKELRTTISALQKILKEIYTQKWKSNTTWKT